MSYDYVHTALARERQNMLLAEAQAAHLASQARSRRRRDRAPGGRRSPRRWPLVWLPSARGRLLTSRPESRTNP
jgi:hypothetical protein